MLHELDAEMDRKGLRFVRYAEIFSIYCNAKAEAREMGNRVYVFLRDKLKLPINREKSGIRRSVNFSLLGYSFVPTYQKGIQGQWPMLWVVALSSGIFVSGFYPFNYFFV